MRLQEMERHRKIERERESCNANTNESTELKSKSCISISIKRNHWQWYSKNLQQQQQQHPTGVDFTTIDADFWNFDLCVPHTNTWQRCTAQNEWTHTQQSMDSSNGCSRYYKLFAFLLFLFWLSLSRRRFLSVHIWWVRCTVYTHLSVAFSILYLFEMCK